MPSLFHARNGELTCKSGTRWLHSPFEPSREAMRIAESELGNTKPAFVITVGSCLDYLGKAIHSIMPKARILAVQYDSFFKGKEAASASIFWYPDSLTNLADFIFGHLDEDAIAGVKIIECKAASLAYPEMAAKYLGEISVALDRFSASLNTSRYFGARWIVNSLRNYMLLASVVVPEKVNKPALVIASGPSLDFGAAELLCYRRHFLVCAVSSALAACLHHGIVPDFVISTDGGYYSKLHLYPLTAHRLPLCAPLTAMPFSSRISAQPILLLNQGSPIETALLDNSLPCIRLPSHGTVTGSAIAVCKAITEGPIFVAGFDVAFYNGREHCTPHGFDSFIWMNSNRLRPSECTHYSRSAHATFGSGKWKSTRAQKTFAQSFKAENSDLIYRYAPSGQALESMESIEAGGLAKVLAKKLGISEVRISGNAETTPASLSMRTIPFALSRVERQERIRIILDTWQDQAMEGLEELSMGNFPRSAIAIELFVALDIEGFAHARKEAFHGVTPSGIENIKAKVDNFFAKTRQLFINT